MKKVRELVPRIRPCTKTFFRPSTLPLPPPSFFAGKPVTNFALSLSRVTPELMLKTPRRTLSLMAAEASRTVSPGDRGNGPLPSLAVRVRLKKRRYTGRILKRRRCLLLWWLGYSNPRVVLPFLEGRCCYKNTKATPVPAQRAWDRQQQLTRLDTS